MPDMQPVAGSDTFAGFAFHPALPGNDRVQLAVQDGIAVIRMSRPDQMNALDPQLATALHATCLKAEQDAAVRAVVLTGGPVFMAGGDVKFFAGQTAGDPERRRSDFDAMFHTAHGTIECLRRMGKPVVAAVNGSAAGYGLSLMLAADIVLCAADAVLTAAYCLIGTTPDGGMTYHMPRATGTKKAMELALTGDRFTGSEAERWGMVNRALPMAEVEAEAHRLAARLAAGPVLALARTKALINRSGGSTLEGQLRAEQESFVASVQTHDFVEGVAAFVDKRKPGFTGT